MSKPPKKKIRDLEDFAGIASDWFWETDSEHRFTYFSNRIEQVVGFTAASLIGKRRDTITAENADDPHWQRHFDDLANRRPFREFEYMVRRVDFPGPLWVRTAGQPKFDKKGNFLGYCGTGHDVTAEKTAILRLEQSNAALQERNRQLDEARQIIERAAFEDSLTGLPNRRAFERDLQKAIAETGQRVGLLQIDLDRFKWVNDTWGHPAGDEVLRLTANRLRAATGRKGCVYRIGGDEFMVIVHGNTTQEHADWIGDSIVEKMDEPLPLQQQQLVSGASVGIAVSEPGPSDMGDLIRHADMALYEAKRGGRGAACRITPALLARMEDRRRLIADIPAGLERGEFIPYFQPQIDAETNVIIGVEALVRWQHPERGLLAPATFLEGACSLGLTSAIDRAILRESMATVNRLAATGVILPALALNISEARLLDARFPADITEHWTERRCQLCLELLETIYFDDTQNNLHFSQILHQLRDLGVSIEIDDFGSGRASITGLIKIQPDRLKIDRGLVKDVVSDPKKRSVVLAILEMSQALGIDAIAEGVETQTDIDAMRDLGCRAFQGYAIARPLSEDSFAAFLVGKKIGHRPETKTAGPKGLPRIA
ncbi:EAL domain-containing protein [Loktanella agnita]|uniref:sensor domain-containing protein n=1 Tax=Loktanella agnita TaxID=287097 RepID=UPI00398A0600